MVYFRGHPKDYDDWAAEGNRGWGWADVLPYFLRSENNTEYAGSPYHGHSGPMAVSSIHGPNPLNRVFADAMQSLQFRHCDDFNGPTPEGYGLRQGAIRDGRRESGVTAFLKPAVHRPNLKVMTEATLARVVLTEGRARGVDVFTGKRDAARRCTARGDPQRWRDRFAADAFCCRGSATARPYNNSASWFSTTCPASAGTITITSPPTCRCGRRTRSLTAFRSRRCRVARGTCCNTFSRGGPFASNVFESHAILRSVPGLDRPDIQVVFQPARRNQNMFPLPLGHGFVLSIVLLHPKSRGALTLASADPRAKPLVDPALLSAPDDIEPLVRGLKLTRRVFATPAFAPYRATEFLPGASVANDDAWKDYVRAHRRNRPSSGRKLPHGHR